MTTNSTLCVRATENVEDALLAEESFDDAAQLMLHFLADCVFENHIEIQGSFALPLTKHKKAVLHFSKDKRENLLLLERVVIVDEAGWFTKNRDPIIVGILVAVILQIGGSLLLF